LGFDDQSVGLRSANADPVKPVNSIALDDVGCEFPIKAAANKSVIVTLEAQDSQVVKRIVAVVRIDMVDLNRAARSLANTANAIEQEQYFARNVGRHLNLPFVHDNQG
jgi:hypothetical protein